MKSQSLRAARFRPAVFPALLALMLLLSGCDIFGEAIDERAPRVTIGRPYDGAVLTGGNVLVKVGAEALGTDNYVSFINVNLDGVRVGEATAENGQYVFRWDTRTSADGLHRLEAVAFDRYQARGISEPIMLTIQNFSSAPGPELTIVEPENGAEVSGNVRILARTIPGQPPVSRVELLVDGLPVTFTETLVGGDSFILDWDTGAETAGSHVVELKTYSGADVFRINGQRTLTIAAPVDGGGTDKPGSVLFRGASFDGDVKGSVAVGFNNDLYIGSSNGMLYAFDEGGNPRWTFTARGPIRSSPVVGNNEDVFFTSEDGHLYGLNSAGRQLWTPYPQQNPSAEFRGTPALGVDGILYFGDSIGRLHAVNTFSGLAVPGWPIQVTSASIVVPPAIARDRTVVVASTDGYLYAIGADGSQLWKSARNFGGIQVGMAIVERELTVTLPTGEIRRSAAVLAYVVSNDGSIYAVAGEDGSVVWSYPLTGPLRSGPVVGNDGTIYVGSSTGLFALNEEADAFSPRLRFIHPAEDVGTPAIDANGVIHFTSGKRVVAINPNNTPYWNYTVGTQIDGPLTINRAGHLLTAGANGLVYSLQTGSVGLSEGKWPMYMRNARHTGRLGIDADDG